MLDRHRRKTQGGYTIIEILIAMAVLVIVTQAFAVFMKTAAKVTTADRNKAEAIEHAVQMLEELRGVVLDDNADIETLDTYSDGRDATGVPYYKFTLTTKAEIIKPQGLLQADNVTGIHKLSGNPVNSKGFFFVRHVDIARDVNDKYIRKIHVRVWPAAPNAGPSTPSTAAPAVNSKLPMAEVFGTVRSLAKGNAPTQVMDIYLIALENVPGWWSRTSNLIPIMRASLISLQARNPGLILRPHWIRRLSYGRDVEYTPEVNASTRGDVSGAFTKAYIYPGFIQYDDSDDYYYLPTWFKGRITLDGVVQNGGGGSVDGYPMADQWNHAMRLPDEERLFAIHQQVNLNRGAEAPEISLRMLLEKMNDPSDTTMVNSVVINLHGEMVPIVPLRNYSDAAKDPEYYWNGRGGSLSSRAWRAVTHPESLSFAAGADMALRTYAYDMNARSYADPITPSVEDDVMNYVTVFIPGATLDNLKSLQRMQGNSRVTYAWKNYVGNTYTANATSWQYITASTALSDANAINKARWWADNYTPNGRVQGLRIVFQGVTPTSRLFSGLPYVP